MIAQGKRFVKGKIDRPRGKNQGNDEKQFEERKKGAVAEATAPVGFMCYLDD